MKVFDVFGLGQCSLDYIGRLGAYPPPGVKTEFSDLTVQGGGPVATALVALSRWGLRCAFSGVVGDDAFGRVILKSLKEEGIHTGGVAVRRGGASQFAFIAAESPGGRRTVFWQRPTGEPLARGEVDLAVLGKAKVFLTDGLFIEAALDAAKKARAAGIPVVVDGGTLREGMLDLARLSDYFIASESFGQGLAGGGDPAGACRRIRELGPCLAAVTLGERGYAASFAGKELRTPAYPVEAVDTTGCGDVFHAGFILGLLWERGPEKSLDLGAWAASRVATGMGGRAGIPPLKEMTARLERPAREQEGKIHEVKP